jgi:hypothetical protein
VIHDHELAAPPIRALVYRLIEDKIWDRHLLGFTSVKIEFVKLDPAIIEDLKARYKRVEMLSPDYYPVKELRIEWA